MRPDAHKKKASSQYKKKHGLSTDKKSDAATDRRAKPADSGTNRQCAKPAQMTRDDAGAKSWRPDGVTPGTSSAAADSSNPQVVPAPSFRRREVQSNWSRYEGLDGDEQTDRDLVRDHLRGADYSLLLKVNSTSSSQFRFADEQDWEEEYNASGAGASAVAQLLTVDCVDLACALRCEPLHTRLGLDNRHFSADQIARFRAAAESNKQEYRRSRVVRSEIKYDDDIEEMELDSAGETSLSSECETDGEPDEERSEQTRDNVGETTVRDPHRSPQPLVIKQKKSPQSKAQSSKPKQTESALPTKSAQGRQVNVVTAEAEDDLDFLLSLDQPVKSPDESSSEADTLGEDTDRLSPIQIKAPTPVQQKTTTKAESTATTTNLEDWLDDFLDD